MNIALVAGDRDGWRHMDAVGRALAPGMPPATALCRAGLAPISGARTVFVEDCNGLQGAVKRATGGRRFDAVFVATSRDGPDLLTKSMAEDSAEARLCVVQEYWGDALGATQASGGQPLYLVRDALAASLTCARLPGAEVRVVGSPKYASFERVDVLATRHERRMALGIAPDGRLAGWFGQAPLAEASYRLTLRAFAEAISARGDTKLVYRPHPRETPGQAAASADEFRRCGVDVHLAAEGETWQWLAAVDAVFACFSNCCADAVQLNRVAAQPLGSAAFMLFDQGLRDYHLRMTGLADPPLAMQGLAFVARDRAALAGTIDAALDRGVIEEQWKLARRLVIPGSEAARNSLGEAARAGSSSPTASASRGAA